MVLSPLQSAELIASIAKDVKISKEGIEKASELVMQDFLKGKYDITKYKLHTLHPKTMEKSSVDWIFLVDTLNFSFWSTPGKEFVITFEGETYSGYWSLCAAINRAIKEGHNITSPEYFSSLSLETLKHILRSDSGVEMPLLKERHAIIMETGKTLINKFGSSFANCIEQCNNSACKLLEIIVENFPSYRDEATIEDQEVSFYKRAQILIGDIWACFEGKSYGEFNDIDKITMFADYRIPQALVYLGVLSYSDELKNRLNEDKLLQSGERQEVEIRGCTIWAVELICQCIKRINKVQFETNSLIINPILVDNFLWDYRRSHAQEMEHIPFHKIRCIYY